jgi:hypothetical protein
MVSFFCESWKRKNRNAVLNLYPLLLRLEFVRIFGGRLSFQYIGNKKKQGGTSVHISGYNTRAIDVLVAVAAVYAC